jgi:cobalt-zinc-cadmium efflux system outer membrane protein
MLLSIFMRAPWLAFSLALVLTPAIPLYASEEQAAPLVLHDALARTLASSPALAIYPWRERADDARVLQASLRPNPELAAEIENIAGSGDYSGTSAMNVTLALSQVIELGDKRDYRRLAAESESGLTRFDYELARLDVLAETARRFVDVARAQAVLELAQRASLLAAGAEEVAGQRVARGRSAPSELSQARIERARIEIDREHAEHALATARIRLAASWGEMHVRFGDVLADLRALPPVPSLDDFLVRVDEAPGIQRYFVAERVAAAQEALARANARQNLRVGVGIRHFEDTSDQAFLLQFSVPLPVADRNQGAIAAASADQRTTQAQRHRSRIETHAVLFGLYQELDHARTESATLQSEVLPEAQSMMGQVDQGYREGRFSYLELSAARRQLLEVERAAIEAYTQAHKLLIELERLTGVPLLAQASLPHRDTNP